MLHLYVALIPSKLMSFCCDISINQEKATTQCTGLCLRKVLSYVQMCIKTGYLSVIYIVPFN